MRLKVECGQKTICKNKLEREGRRGYGFEEEDEFEGSRKHQCAAKMHENLTASPNSREFDGRALRGPFRPPSPLFRRARQAVPHPRHRGHQARGEGAPKAPAAARAFRRTRMTR